MSSPVYNYSIFRFRNSFLFSTHLKLHDVKNYSLLVANLVIYTIIIIYILLFLL